MLSFLSMNRDNALPVYIGNLAEIGVLIHPLHQAPYACDYVRHELLTLACLITLYYFLLER